MSDLIVLTADLDARLGLDKLLSRTDELGIRAIEFKTISHPNHDGGVRKRAEVLLRQYLQWKHALVVFDREGSGSEGPADAVESEVHARLEANGWERGCAVVAIEPELESWVWDGSLQADRMLSWPGGVDKLGEWLRAREFLRPDEAKPARPKEALEAALRERNIRRSSTFYSNLAACVRTQSCTDRAFRQMVAALQQWFPRP